MDSLVYIDELEKNIKAKDVIKPNTDLGVAFILKSLTGDYEQDFERTEFGRYLRQNQFFANCKIIFRGEKVHVVTTRKVKPGEVIYVSSLPFVHDVYINRLRKEKHRKLMRTLIDA